MYAPPDSHIATPPRIGDLFSEALRLFGQEWKVWLLQGLAYFLMSGLLLLPGTVMLVSSVINLINSSSAPAAPPPDLIPFITGFGVFMGGSCVGAFFHVYLLGGMFRTAWKQLRGEAIAFADIFSAGDVYVALLGAYLLENLAHYLASQFCGLLSLALAGMWVFVHPLIVDGKMGVFEAFSKSWNVAKEHFLHYVCLVLVMGLVVLAGYLVGCGAMATLPIATLMLVLAYRSTFERPETPVWSAPIVNPAAPPVYYGPAGPPTVGGTCPACNRLIAAGSVVCSSCGAQLHGGPGTPPSQGG